MKFGYLTSDGPAAVYAWARRLVDDLNRAPMIGDLPVFADDASAAAGRVGVGDGYVTPDGIVRRRVV